MAFRFLGFARLLLQWGVASGQDSSFKDQQKIRTVGRFPDCDSEE